jgi:hypothetical protein
VEVLSAYIREHVSWGSDTEDSPIPQDIQGALTVLRRRTHSYGSGENEPINLRGAILRNGNAFKINLEEADLIHIRLDGANLRGARLDRAILGLAHLKGTNLISAHLTEANLIRANLSTTTMMPTARMRCELRRMPLPGTSLTKGEKQAGWRTPSALLPFRRGTRLARRYVRGRWTSLAKISVKGYRS